MHFYIKVSNCRRDETAAFILITIPPSRGPLRVAASNICGRARISNNKALENTVLFISNLISTRLTGPPSNEEHLISSGAITTTLALLLSENWQPNFNRVAKI